MAVVFQKMKVCSKLEQAREESQIISDINPKIIQTMASPGEMRPQLQAHPKVISQFGGKLEIQDEMGLKSQGSKHVDAHSARKLETNDMLHPSERITPQLAEELENQQHWHCERAKHNARNSVRMLGCCITDTIN